MSDSSIIYGLIGFPVKHSLSAAMHNAAFKHLNIAAVYRLFEVRPSDLEDFLLNPDKEVSDIEGSTVRVRDIAGFNITIPHKVKALQILEREFASKDNDFLVQEHKYYVRLSGAVNTVKKKNGRVEWYNTDAEGFLRSLKEDLNFDATAKTILVIGCGGAGRAVVAALSWKGHKAKKIYIHDINDEAISNMQKYIFSLSTEWKSVFGKKIEIISSFQIAEKLKECQLLVNASSVGMREADKAVIDQKLLHNDLCIYDLVYNRDTELIKQAKEKGLTAAGGKNMLLYQGKSAFELWAGKEAPVKIMRQALDSALQK